MSAVPPNPYESPQTISTFAHEEPRPIWDEIEVEYELTIEDYVAFNMHHMSRSPAHRRQRAIVYLLALIVVELANAFLLFNQAFSGPLRPETVIFHVAIAVVFLVVFGGLALRAGRSGTNSWLIKRALRSMFAQGDPSVMIGKRRFRVTADRLEELSELRESRWKLQCVQRIDVTPQYAFIYVAPVMAFILPVRAFVSPDHFATFVSNLAGHTGKIAERIKA